MDIDIDNVSVMAGNGRLYNPFSLNCGDFADIEPIATALSRIHRFWGQTPLTVAQHCVAMAEWFLQEEGDVTLAHWALMHEVAEAFLGDVPTPIKAVLPQYKALEKSILERMASCLRLPYPMPKEVKELDKRIMINEALTFMPNKAYWLGLHIKPLDLPEPIQAWDNGEAKWRFIDCHKRLLKLRGYDYE
jgi:hypothetical protein